MSLRFLKHARIVELQRRLYFFSGFIIIKSNKQTVAKSEIDCGFETKMIELFEVKFNRSYQNLIKIGRVMTSFF